MGKGIFKDDFPIIGVHLVRLYYVLMGASVGANVKVDLTRAHTNIPAFSELTTTLT